MTQKEVLTKISADAGITQKQAKAALDSFAGSVIAMSQIGAERVVFSDIGYFKPVLKKGRPARTGRNPKTGASVQIASTMDKLVIKFVPAKDYR